jgi:sulfur transfer protein SufE
MKPRSTLAFVRAFRYDGAKGQEEVIKTGTDRGKMTSRRLSAQTNSKQCLSGVWVAKQSRADGLEFTVKTKMGR